jgi:hypothetical protein
MEYTLSLALVDFLPVIFTASGLIAITRMVSFVNSSQGRVALIGTLLIVAGGFFKATWKLLMASSNGTVNIGWMEEGLFIFMAPGYTLLVWSVWQTVRTLQGSKAYHTWIPPLTIIVIMFSISAYLFITNPESPAWERVLLSMVVLASLVTGLFLIVFGFRQKLRTAGWLFILNLVGIFLLNGLARLDDQTIVLQWVEEIINSVAWLAFAIASNQVYEYTQTNFGVGTEPIAPAITA